MKLSYKDFILLTLLLIGFNVIAKELDLEAVETSHVGFEIFDATLFKEKPDIQQYGIKPLEDISHFWEKGESQEELPSESRIKNIAVKRALGASHAFINIEHWPLKGEPDLVYKNIVKYRNAIEWVKEAIPETQVGLYSMFPGRDYWRATKGIGTPEYKQWQKENNALSTLAHSSVDIIFPSLYTFYPDKSGWVEYAIANIKEARRYGTGKPIYVFLWPQYHNSNRLLRGQYIDKGFWKLQLLTAYKYADGIVIWGGWNEKWNDTAPWWKGTKEFMNEVDINVPEK